MYTQMKKNTLHEAILPVISASRTAPKPIKDIMKDLKQRKMMIQQRIKTQWEQSDLQERDKDDSQLHLRDRIITQVPYYIKHKEQLRKNHNQSHMLMNNSFKVQEYTEQQSSQRDSHLRTGNRRHKSILQLNNQFQKKQHHPLSPPPKTRKQILRQIQNILVNVPIDPRDRTQQNIDQLKNYLMQNNMFFAKIHNVIAICLLKLNRLIWVDKHQNIYRMGDQRNAFYIILCGRLKLYNVDLSLKKVHKICTAGETIGQQLIFSTSPKKIVLESAKSIGRCLLIQIKTENYKKMSEEMMRFGYKVNFNEMQSIIKRNFITKNWQRSEKARLRKLQKAT